MILFRVVVKRVRWSIWPLAYCFAGKKSTEDVGFNPIHLGWGDKIQLNKDIQELKLTGQFVAFYDSNRQRMNLVNLTSYLRRFVDFQLSSGQMRENLAHTLSVLGFIADQIESQKYLLYRDRPKDISRSFSMLLSVQTEIFLKTHEPKVVEFMKRVFITIKNQKSYDLFNTLELATFYRCLSVFSNHLSQEDKSQFQQYLKKKKVGNFDLHAICKFLHSISTLGIPIDKQVFLALIQPLSTKLDQSSEVAKLNHMDISSVFISLKTFQSQDTASYEEVGLLLAKASSVVYRNQMPMPALTLGVIYNSLANLAQLYPADQSLLKFLEKRLQQADMKEMSIQILAHIFQYYEVSKQPVKLEQEFLDILEDRLCSFNLGTQSDIEFFFLLVQSMANSKIVMLKLTGKLPQILKNASAKNLINQFCLIQCLEFLKAMKVTNSGLREFATIVCSHVTGSKSPASLHMLYAVSSALPSFLFEDLVDQLGKYLLQQIEEHGETVVVKAPLSNLSSSQQFLTSLQLIFKIRVAFSKLHYEPLIEKLELLINQLFDGYQSKSESLPKTDETGMHIIRMTWLQLGLTLKNAEQKENIHKKLMQEAMNSPALANRIKQQANPKKRIGI